MTPRECVVTACHFFRDLPELEEDLYAEIPNYENLPIFEKFANKLNEEKERFYILELSDKIMISLNKIPWGIDNKFTLSVFRRWCYLKSYIDTLHSVIRDDNFSTNLINVVKSVDLKVNRFFFSGLIYFKKMNIEIVNKSFLMDSREDFMDRVIQRIKNCETIQDLIDDSPTAECPVCMDVTFTESTHFRFTLSCNHLVCLSCSDQLVKYNNMLVKNILFFFLLISWIFLFKTFSNVDPFLLNSG